MCADKKKTNQTKRATHFSQNHTNTPRDNRSRDSMQFEEEVEKKTTTTNKLVLFDINFYLLLFLRVSLCCPYARQPKKKPYTNTNVSNGAALSSYQAISMLHTFTNSYTERPTTTNAYHTNVYLQRSQWQFFSLVFFFGFDSSLYSFFSLRSCCFFLCCCVSLMQFSFLSVSFSRNSRFQPTMTSFRFGPFRFFFFFSLLDWSIWIYCISVQLQSVVSTQNPTKKPKTTAHSYANE